MKRRLSCWLLVPILCWLSAVQARADQAEDEVAIRKMVASYTAAFNKRDAKAVAAHWLPDAVYRDPDSRKQIVGRAAIEKHFAAEFSDVNQDGAVYSDGQQIATAEQYTTAAEQIATSIPPAQNPDWMTLGVFAITQDGQASGPAPTMFRAAQREQGRHHRRQLPEFYRGHFTADRRHGR